MNDKNKCRLCELAKMASADAADLLHYRDLIAPCDRADACFFARSVRLLWESPVSHADVMYRYVLLQKMPAVRRKSGDSHFDGRAAFFSPLHTAYVYIQLYGRTAQIQK